MEQYNNLGQKLTNEQIEYFKNSKVRDSKGNLLVCYHGTPKPGFLEFNPQNDNSQFGKYKFKTQNINYFTTEKEVAVGYTELGYEDKGNVYAYYLNIINPFIINNVSKAEYKSWMNIQDEQIRKAQKATFNQFINKWDDMPINEDDLEDINKDLFYFNYEIRPSIERPDSMNNGYSKQEGEYDLWALDSNTMYGSKHIEMYNYPLEDYFNDEYTKEEFFEHIFEEDDEYYKVTNDDVVKWVLWMNENQNTNYDGIIIPDIYDTGPRGNMFSSSTTDIITLKSSNQIKLVNNEKPTNSNKINENYVSNTFELGTAGYILENGDFSYTDEYHGDDGDDINRERCLPEFSSTHREDDTCVRIYKEPNQIQYDRLEQVIDKLLYYSGYCKVEIWNPDYQHYNYYKIFSTYEGACDDYSQEELVGNWSGYDLVKRIKEYFKKHLNEQLLLELNRSGMVAKAKSADNYKDTSKGKNRYERRLLSRVSNDLRTYSNLDMDGFFKRDILTINIQVQGETNTYVVSVRFKGVLRELANMLKSNPDVAFNSKFMNRALSRVFNSADLQFKCSCP